MNKLILTLSEVFVLLPEKSTYSMDELSLLDLHPDFIHKMLTEYDLMYVEDVIDDGNVCFAEDTKVRSEYRSNFYKSDILRIIHTQIPGDFVNAKQYRFAYLGTE